MDTYYEQSVAGVRNRRNTVLYMLSWCLIAVLLLIAMLFGANVFAEDPGSLQINWLNAILLVLCLATALILFVRKDALRMDYDYILLNDTLEIYGILNSRRRKRLAVIHLNAIKSGGSAQSMHCASLQQQRGVKTLRWCGENCRNYLYYMEENARHLALLDLDRQMCDLIRRQLPAGVWRDAEGKS